MRITQFLYGIIFLTSFSIHSCKVQTPEADGDTYTGKLEATGMTTYQYGSHTLTTSTEFYALRSSSVELEKHEGKTVTLKADIVEGYPVDGGPTYLEVISVE